MFRSDMIEFMEDNPNIKITHELFGSGEYIVMKNDGKVYDENNYLFEDWESDHNGIRMRSGGNWETGWSVVHEKSNCKLLSQTDSGREYLYYNWCRTCQYFHGACLYM